MFKYPDSLLSVGCVQIRVGSRILYNATHCNIIADVQCNKPV